MPLPSVFVVLAGEVPVGVGDGDGGVEVSEGNPSPGLRARVEFKA